MKENEGFSKTPEPERVAIILFQWSQSVPRADNLL